MRAKDSVWCFRSSGPVMQTSRMVGYVNTTEVEAVEKTDRDGDVQLLRHEEPVVCREVGGVRIRR